VDMPSLLTPLLPEVVPEIIGNLTSFTGVEGVGHVWVNSPHPPHLTNTYVRIIQAEQPAGHKGEPQNQLPTMLHEVLWMHFRTAQPVSCCLVLNALCCTGAWKIMLLHGDTKATRSSCSVSILQLHIST